MQLISTCTINGDIFGRMRTVETFETPWVKKRKKKRNSLGYLQEHSSNYLYQQIVVGFRTGSKKGMSAHRLYNFKSMKRLGGMLACQHSVSFP